MAKENLLNKLKMKRLFDQDTDSGVCSSRLSGIGTVASSWFSILSQVFFLGLYTVVWQVSDQNYLISTPEWKWHSQLCHVILLKPFYSHSSVFEKAPVAVAVAATVTEVDEDVKVSEDSILLPWLNSETLYNICIFRGELSC